VTATLSPIEIRRIRKSLGLSQEAMAQAMGFSSKTVVSRWERGRTEPSRKALAAIRHLKHNGVERRPDDA